MGLGSLGERTDVTTSLSSGTIVRSVPLVFELGRRLNERMDMCATTAQASLHENVPRGSETPMGHDEPQALEALAAKARKQDEPEGGGAGAQQRQQALAASQERAAARPAVSGTTSSGASAFQGICVRCHKWGYKAAQCRAGRSHDARQGHDHHEQCRGEAGDSPEREQGGIRAQVRAQEADGEDVEPRGVLQRAILTQLAVQR